MTLDQLYKKIKTAKYPINERKEFERTIKGLRVKFENDYFDDRDISTMITEYPIKSPSQLIQLFIKAAAEEYEDEKTAKEFAKDMK